MPTGIRGLVAHIVVYMLYDALSKSRVVNCTYQEMLTEQQ